MPYIHTHIAMQSKIRTNGREITYHWTVNNCRTLAQSLKVMHVFTMWTEESISCMYIMVRCIPDYDTSLPNWFRIWKAVGNWCNPEGNEQYISTKGQSEFVDPRKVNPSDLGDKAKVWKFKLGCLLRTLNPNMCSIDHHTKCNHERVATTAQIETKVCRQSICRSRWG